MARMEEIPYTPIMRGLILAGLISALGPHSPSDPALPGGEQGWRLRRVSTSPQESLEQAARFKAEGRIQEAVRSWAEIWTEDPQSALAADALYLAGETLVEAGDYPEAERLLGKLLKDYPSHRLAPRARRRLDRLREERQSGDAPLREYQDILGRYYRMDPEEAVRRMREVIERYPDFALRSRALLWLGGRTSEVGRFDEAIRWFDRCLESGPSAEEMIEALEGKGAALSRQHRYDEARDVFAQMKTLRPEAASRAEVLIQRSHAHQMRRNVYVLGFLPFQFVCLAAIAVFLPWRSVGWNHVRSGLREIAFVAPLLLAFYAILATRNPFTARGVLVLLTLVPPVLFLNSLYAQTGPMPRVLRWVYPWLGVSFVVGVVYGVLYAYDLVFVFEQIWGGEVEWK